MPHIAAKIFRPATAVEKMNQGILADALVLFFSENPTTSSSGNYNTGSGTANRSWH